MATTEKMSVTRALAELKMMDKRISSAIDQLQPLDIMIGSTKPTFISARDLTNEQQVSDRIKSAMQSLDGMMKRRAAINAAIVQSNAVTQVTIAGGTFTVAEVIKMKDYVQTKRTLSTRLKATLNAYLREMDKNNKKVEDEIARRMTAILSRDSEGSADERKMVEDAVQRQLSPKLIDPLQISDMIQKLDAEVDEFETNVDYVLSEINAKTDIEVTIA